MKKQLSRQDLLPITEFSMPHYIEIPNVGLYLKQVVRLINDSLEPYLGITVTETMLSNYVKMHLIPNPTKKQYDRDQIAMLIFIALAKTVISLDNIQLLLEMQRATCSTEAAYVYFCEEFEAALMYVFGYRDELSNANMDSDPGRSLLQNVIITIAHKCYLENRFAELRPANEE